MKEVQAVGGDLDLRWIRPREEEVRQRRLDGILEKHRHSRPEDLPAEVSFEQPVIESQSKGCNSLPSRRYGARRIGSSPACGFAAVFSKAITM